jgi:hypothetical protein
MLVLKSDIFNQLDPLVKKHFSNWTLFDVVCDDFYGQGSVVLQNKANNKEMFCLGALFEVVKRDGILTVTKLVSFYMSQEEMSDNIKKYGAIRTSEKTS